MQGSVEVLRRLGRRTLPKSVFATLSSWADFCAGVLVLPMRDVRELMTYAEKTGVATVDETWDIRASVLLHPFRIRKSPQDARSFINTCLRSEYGPVLPNVAPDFIIDAGAYIGDCAALMLSRFPAARLVALEPQPDAYELARENLKPYGAAARVIHGALWSEDGVVSVAGAGTGATVSNSEKGPRVPCFSVARILQVVGFPRIDLLKCDIEGAEVEVFAKGDRSWLEHTGRVLIECHSAAAADAVRFACASAGLAYSRRYRSTHVFERRSRE